MFLGSEMIPFTLFAFSILPLFIRVGRWHVAILRSWSRSRKQFSPQLFLDWLEDAVFLLERNGDLNHAIKSASESVIGSGSELISVLQSRMQAGAFLDEALMSPGLGALNHVERAVFRVLLAAPRGGRSEILRGLKMCRSTVQSNIWYLHKFSATTAQSVLQFWVLCLLGPGLLTILVVMFPELILAALGSFPGVLSLGASLLLYILGVSVFRFFIASGSSPLSSRTAGARALLTFLEKWLPQDQPAWLWSLHEFVEVLRIELSAGSSPARAVSLALEELQSQSSLVFDGTQELLRAHEPLAQCLRRASDSTPLLLRRLLGRLALCCDDRDALCACLEAESESLREQFRSSLEASGGTLAVKLLIPLCLFLFPSILLLILGPVLAVMGPLLH